MDVSILCVALQMNSVQRITEHNSDKNKVWV